MTVFLSHFRTNVIRSSITEHRNHSIDRYLERAIRRNEAEHSREISGDIVTPGVIGSYGEPADARGHEKQINGH